MNGPNLEGKYCNKCKYPLENCLCQPEPMKIKSVRFVGRGQVDVMGTFEDGEFRLFCYYDDELSFTEAELIGLTKHEAWELFIKKDQAYLLS